MAQLFLNGSTLKTGSSGSPLISPHIPGKVLHFEGPGLIARSPTNARVTSGLIALYEFTEGSGATVADTSGFGTPLNLTIENTNNVAWGSGSIAVNGTIISSVSAATKLHTEITGSNEFTVEAWVIPANTTQTGPARIVTYSISIYSRNFTLGQQAAEYNKRVRSGSSGNGTSGSLSTTGGQATTTLTHVVLTHGIDETDHIYVDGAENASNSIGSDLSSWDATHVLSLGNEHGADRIWRGEFHLVAIYSRELTPAEVLQNYNAGV